jgi:lysophospholipase L1-like esterase
MQKRKKIFIIVSILLTVVIVGSCVFLFGFYLPKQKEQAERERIIKEYYANKLSLYQTENEQYADYEVDVAFLGDSLTDGYDVKKYYPQYTVVNRGIGGETTHGLENRLQVSVYDLKPKIAVMLIGGNNINTMFENYENILIGFQENLPQTKIILVSLTAMGNSWGHKNKIAAYNNVVIKKLAAKYGFAFVDLYTPLFNEESGEIYAEYTTDGVHFTPLGYEVFTQTLTPTIAALMGGGA